MLGKALGMLPESVADKIRANSAVLRFRGKPARMTVGYGAGLAFDPGPSNSAYASGNNELPFQAALAGCLAPGATFYDVGANVGFFTVIAAKLVGPEGTVYAFEPVPENAAFVRRNVKLNGFRNVTILEKAVSSSSGRGALWVAEYSGGAALATAAKPPDPKKLIQVGLVSIDSIVFGGDSRPPSVVKIDVEGAEIGVLRGMSRTLREVRPTVAYEIDDATPEDFARKYRECEEFLESFGYSVRRLPDSYPDARWVVGHAIATPDRSEPPMTT